MQNSDKEDSYLYVIFFLSINENIWIVKGVYTFKPKYGVLFPKFMAFSYFIYTSIYQVTKKKWCHYKENYAILEEKKVYGCISTWINFIMATVFEAASVTNHVM